MNLEHSSSLILGSYTGLENTVIYPFWGPFIAKNWHKMIGKKLQNHLLEMAKQIQSLIYGYWRPNMSN